MRQKPSKTTVVTWIEREGHEVDVTLSGVVYPGRPGRISGPPEDCYEDEPWEVDDIEIESVDSVDGNVPSFQFAADIIAVGLTDKEIASVYDDFIDAYGADRYAGPDVDDDY